MKNKGITLIALVVTIIVLIILAGISISLILGENGLIEKAKLSKIQTEKASAKERIEMEVIGSYDDEGNLLASNVINNIRKNIPEATIEGENFPIIVTLNGYSFKIEENGKVDGIKSRPIVNKNNVIITLEDGTEIPEEGVDEGTKLKIEFTPSVENGKIISISPTLPHITEGTEKEVIFTIVVEVEGEKSNVQTTLEIKDKYKKTEVEAVDIAKFPKTYYGSLVSNYKNDAGVSAWRIFYADDENIYLIADNYLAYNNAPAGKNGGSVSAYGSNGYGVAINYAKDDYPERNAWTRENSKGKAWLEDYLVTNRTGYSQEQIVAYLMDTNIFSKFVDSNVAEYCLGGPPLPMFIKSYNDVFINEKIEYKCETNSYCYQVSKDGSTYSSKVENLGDKTTEYNGIYFKSYSGVNKFYLIGPVTDAGGDGHEATASIASTQCSINCSSCYMDVPVGMRPVVCLKSGIVLKKTQNDTFEILYPEEPIIMIDNENMIATIQYDQSYLYNNVQRLYKIDDGEWQIYNDIGIQLQNGQTLYAKGIDKNGNETIASKMFFKEVELQPGVELQPLIPKLTSNTGANGKVNCSSKYGDNWDGWIAFNERSSGDGWYATSSPAWIQYNFNNSTIVKRIYIYAEVGSSGSGTTGLIMQCSNDGINYYNVMKEYTYTIGNKTYIDIEETKSAKFWRLQFTKAERVYNLQFYGT